MRVPPIPAPARPRSYTEGNGHAFAIRGPPAPSCEHLAEVKQISVPLTH